MCLCMCNGRSVEAIWIRVEDWLISQMNNLEATWRALLKAHTSYTSFLGILDQIELEIWKGHSWVEIGCVWFTEADDCKLLLLEALGENGINSNEFLYLADQFGTCSEQKPKFIRPPTESCPVWRVLDSMQWTANKATCCFIMTLIGEHYSDNNHYLVYCVSITGFLTTTSVMRGALLFQEAYRSAESFKNLSECDGFWILP